MPDAGSGSGISRRQALRIAGSAGAALALGGGLGIALFRSGGLRRIRSIRSQMGTRVTVTVFHPDADAARALSSAAFDEMERLEGILSRHRPDTALSRLNHDGTLHESPAELREVLTEARRIWELTSGAFDPTMAPLLSLYESASGLGASAPSSSEVARALALVDYEAVEIQDRRVELKMSGMSLTLDGIAKGYIVDRASALVREGGAERVLIEAGGDLAGAGGTPESDRWNLGIQDPGNPRELMGVVGLQNEGMASSGDYMLASTAGAAPHHILDPRTGRPPGRARGATVIAPTATEADALSTAVFVLGPEAGITLLNGSNGWEGLVVSEDGQAHSTRGFARYLESDMRLLTTAGVTPASG